MVVEVSAPTETGDSRDILLQVSDLRRYFYTVMTREVGQMFEQQSSAPSPFGILISVIIAVVLLIVNQIALFGVMTALISAQIAWSIWARNRSGSETNDLNQISDEIRSGKLPPKLLDAALKRLRWWDHLLVPKDWTPSSRVFDIRKRIDSRLNEINDELNHWESDAGKQELEKIAREQQEAAIRREEQKAKLRSLQSRGAQGVVVSEEKTAMAAAPCDDPAVLTARIVSSAQCDEEIKRILCFQNPKELAQQEKIFHLAMLMKIDKINELLTTVVELRPALEKIKAANLSESVAEALGVLESRRAVVQDLNRINHASVVRLLSYNIQFVKTAIAMRAHGIG